MSEIDEFLRARYRLEAHTARLVAESTGSERWKADWRRLSYHHFDAQVVAGEAPIFDGYGAVATAEFVAGYAPARVLADLDVLLALLDEHAVGGSYWPPGSARKLCKACGSGKPNEYAVEWPCRTLRILAQPFARHPDHKGEEWAP